jgi:hypothetical protein
MASQKKPKTVDDIVNDFHEFHHEKGKSFKDRMKAFEKFQDPDEIHIQQFSHHAHYTVFGHPSDSKNFPGAYNVAHQALDKALKGDKDKFKNEDQLAKILETYVDTFLQKAMGKKFDKLLKSAKKHGVEDKDLREVKGELMSKYYSEDGRSPTNILGDKYLKGLKDKKKIDLIDKLRSIGDRTKQMYVMNLANDASSNFFHEDDRSELADYLTPVFKKAGFKHDKPHIMRTAAEQAKHYGTLLSGGHKDLQDEHGYKFKKPSDKAK